MPRPPPKVQRDPIRVRRATELRQRIAAMLELTSITLAVANSAEISTTAAQGSHNDIETSATAASLGGDSNDEALILVLVAKPCTTFHGFKKLPPELRLKIWKLVCWTGRVVDLTARYFAKDIRGQLMSVGSACDWSRVASTVAIPGILHVSREARYAGLQHYSPEFRSKCVITSDGKAIIDSSPSAFINWDVDIISPVWYADRQNSPLGPYTLDPTPMQGFLQNQTCIKRLAVEDVYIGRCFYIIRGLLQKNRIEELILYTMNGIRGDEIYGNSSTPIYDSDHSVTIWVDGSKPKIARDQLIQDIANRPDYARTTRTAFNELCELVSMIDIDINQRVSQGDTGLQNWKRPIITLRLVVQPTPADTTSPTVATTTVTGAEEEDN